MQRAVGEDLQTFAQQKLSGPIGIDANSYFWLRDRAGDTYAMPGSSSPHRSSLGSGC